MADWKGIRKAPQLPGCSAKSVSLKVSGRCLVRKRLCWSRQRAVAKAVGLCRGPAASSEATGLCPALLQMRPFRVDAFHWTSSHPCVKGRRTTSPNLNQAISTWGYSCRPDLHRNLKKKKNQTRQAHIEMVDKILEEIHFTEKKKSSRA